MVPPNYATGDHVKPRSHKGENGLHNLVLACARCNGKRGTSLDWVAYVDAILGAEVINPSQASILQERGVWPAKYPAKGP